MKNVSEGKFTLPSAVTTVWAASSTMVEKGFRVLVAESAFEGLRILTQEHVDVLFCDIVMPGMSGIDLARKARQLRPTLKIVFATGYAARAGEAVHLGKLFFKPMRPQQIEAELCEVMSVC
jgi:CheY-like chemotaxis protein